MYDKASRDKLSPSKNGRDYWYRVKKRARDEEKMELFPMWVQLKLPSKDGKKYKTGSVNTKDAFRIIQSIPSPKPRLTYVRCSSVSLRNRTSFKLIQCRPLP